MIALTNSTEQTLAAGQSLTFDTTILKIGCSECHRNNSGAINLTKRNSVYRISFNANIGGTAAGEAQLGITIDGSALPETNCIVTSAAGGDLQNVSASTFVTTCCCGNLGSVLLTNTGTTEINVGVNPNFQVEKVF